MNDKKHIDRLYQEKLKDFEAAPSNAVWENINTELQAGKKDRKVIPLWLKLAGIAAVLLLLFTVGNAVFNSSEEQPDQNTIVNTDDSPNTDTNDTNKDAKKEVINPNINNQEQETLASEETDDNSKKESSSKNTEARKLINKNGKASNAVVAHNPNSTTGKSTKKQKNNPVKDAIKTAKDNAVAHQPKTEDNTNKESSKKTNTTINKQTIDTAIDKNKASEKVVINTSTTENNTISDKTETSKETGDLAKEEENEDAQKTALDEALADNTAKEDPTDEKKEGNKIENRWKVSPSIAPVYFNTLGAGSSIHEQFNKNSKTGEVNMSYGVRGSYALNKKLSVRAGVNKVTLGYSTDDVFVLNNVTATPTDGRFALRNVDLKEDAQNTSFVSGAEFNFAQVPSVISNQIIGSIDQKLGFIEVPLELEYELSDKKLGLRVLGGFSALFLNENEVYSTLNGDSRLIGEATNINKTSFSANLGVGLDFKLTEKFKLNLEPTFKYQLNTFNNTSGDFKPYFIGIYSGFSFKF